MDADAHARAVATLHAEARATLAAEQARHASEEAEVRVLYAGAVGGSGVSAAYEELVGQGSGCVVSSFCGPKSCCSPPPFAMSLCWAMRAVLHWVKVTHPALPWPCPAPVACVVPGAAASKV